MCAQANRFRGFQAIGIFLFFGAAMASLAGATLIWRRPFLDGLWASNARAYHRLAPFGSAAGAGFLVLGEGTSLDPRSPELRQAPRSPRPRRSRRGRAGGRPVRSMAIDTRERGRAQPVSREAQPAVR